MCLKSGYEEWIAAAGETACGGRHKAMAFGEIDLAGADDGKSVFRASTTYALM